jgi:hypothetical protein
MYAFEAEREDEVSLEYVGDMCEVLVSGEVRKGWEFVELDNGSRGYVPDNYIS